MALQGSLIGPVGTELHLFIDNAVRVVVLGQLFRLFLPVENLIVRNIPGAGGLPDIDPYNLGECVFPVIQFDSLSPRNGTIAETICHNQRSAFLAELNHFGVVDLSAYNYKPCPEFLLICRSCPDFFQCLLEFVFDQILGTDVSGKTNFVKFSSCDRRGIQLSEIADFRDQVADFIVIFDRFAQSLIGYVDAVVYMQGLQQFPLQLLCDVIDRNLLVFSGNVNIGQEEFVVSFPYAAEKLPVILTAVHAHADIHARNGIEETVSALNAPFQKRSGEFT